MIKSLCIVDDNEIDVYQVNRVLKKSGLVEHFYSFVDGQEVLDHFIEFDESQKKFEGNFPPDVILLDVNMPRMDGFQFLDEYSSLSKEKKDGLIILMLTSSSQEKDKERASHFPEVKDYFLKPFSGEHLKRISQLLQ